MKWRLLIVSLSVAIAVALTAAWLVSVFTVGTVGRMQTLRPTPLREEADAWRVSMSRGQLSFDREWTATALVDPRPAGATLAWHHRFSPVADPSVLSSARTLGFEHKRDAMTWDAHDGVGAGATRRLRIAVPLLLPILLALLPLATALLPAAVRRRRRSLGLCAGCGHDLHGSIGRCPHCGTAPVESSW